MKDAPNYLGMDRNRFNAEVRPQLISIAIGTQGIAFDRHDLDAWADNYKLSAGKYPISSVNHKRIAFIPGNTSKKHLDANFDKALLLSMKKK